MAGRGPRGRRRRGGDVLDIRDTDRIRIITLNRPDALNAFNEALYDATTEALMAAADDPTVAVVVITGTGRAFSAGTDVIEMSQRNSREHRARRPRVPGTDRSAGRVPEAAHQRGQRSGPRHRHDDAGALRPRVHVDRRPLQVPVHVAGGGARGGEQLHLPDAARPPQRHVGPDELGVAVGRGLQGDGSGLAGDRARSADGRDPAPRPGAVVEADLVAGRVQERRSSPRCRSPSPPPASGRTRRSSAYSGSRPTSRPWWRWPSGASPTSSPSTPPVSEPGIGRTGVGESHGSRQEGPGQAEGRDQEGGCGREVGGEEGRDQEGRRPRRLATPRRGDVQRQAGLRADAGAERSRRRCRARRATKVRRATTSGPGPALRLPARDRRRAGELGGAQGPDPRSRREAHGRARRGPPRSSTPTSRASSRGGSTAGAT